VLVILDKWGAITFYASFAVGFTGASIALAAALPWAHGWRLPPKRWSADFRGLALGRKKWARVSAGPLTHECLFYGQHCPLLQAGESTITCAAFLPPQT
jgi:hypothetical protein